jgi:RimJ/RimL family protein N-acetyltransferase
MMAFVNSYKPPSPKIYVEDLNAPYDINFAIPLPPTLETSRVKLVPFIPSIHGDPFFSAFSTAPELDRYIPISHPTYPEFMNFLEELRSMSSAVLFAIIDKTKSTQLTDNLAGVVALINTSTMNLSVEIGYVITLPAFQRTFVTTNAIGVLLKFCLDVPSEGGIGFRRVVWTAHPENIASVKTAERMGLKQEGRMRWTWAIGHDKIGKKAGKERGEALGRDSIILAICWDDWETGGREQVQKLIDRV